MFLQFSHGHDWRTLSSRMDNSPLGHWMTDGRIHRVITTFERWPRSIFLCVSLIFLILSTSRSEAQTETHEEMDGHRFRLSGLYWRANPTGKLSGITTQPGMFPIDSSTGFGDYSTFLATADWQFKRKHHLFLIISPNTVSRDKVSNESVAFQDNMSKAGSGGKTQLRTFSFGPGYEYDFIRRKRGHLGIAAQINLLDTKGSISALASSFGNGQNVSQSIQPSGSIFAPLPVVGPEAKIILAPRFDRLFAEGFVKRLYFFGYGDFIPVEGMLAAKLTRSLYVKAGYQLGNRLVIHGTTDRLGGRLT